MCQREEQQFCLMPSDAIEILDAGERLVQKTSPGDSDKFSSSRFTAWLTEVSWNHLLVSFFPSKAFKKK